MVIAGKRMDLGFSGKHPERIGKKDPVIILDKRAAGRIEDGSFDMGINLPHGSKQASPLGLVTFVFLMFHDDPVR